MKKQKKQQELQLLAAFRVMSDGDQNAILGLAQACAINQLKKRPKLTLVFGGLASGLASSGTPDAVALEPLPGCVQDKAFRLIR
jgi:hypothetical protein